MLNLDAIDDLDYASVGDDKTYSTVVRMDCGLRESSRDVYFNMCLFSGMDANLCQLPRLSVETIVELPPLPDMDAKVKDV